MNRAARRREEKMLRKFQQKRTFSLEEYSKGTYDAFKLGQQVALDAAQQVLQLGPTRIDRVYDRMLQLESELLQVIKNGGDWYELPGQAKTTPKTNKKATSGQSSS